MAIKVFERLWNAAQKSASLSAVFLCAASVALSVGSSARADKASGVITLSAVIAPMATSQQPLGNQMVLRAPERGATRTFRDQRGEEFYILGRLPVRFRGNDWASSSVDFGPPPALPAAASTDRYLAIQFEDEGVEIVGRLRGGTMNLGYVDLRGPDVKARLMIVSPRQRFQRATPLQMTALDALNLVGAEQVQAAWDIGVSNLTYVKAHLRGDETSVFPRAARKGVQVLNVHAVPF